jgi:hypothetical protein
MGATIAELRADQNSQKRPSELARRAISVAHGGDCPLQVVILRLGGLNLTLIVRRPIYVSAHRRTAIWNVMRAMSLSFASNEVMGLITHDPLVEGGLA